MIARDHRDIVRRPERLEPGAGGGIFDRQREIDQIPGHRDVVGAGGLQVARDRVERLAAMDVFAAAMPVDVAEPALAGELKKPRPQRHVQIGQMCENEHRA